MTAWIASAVAALPVPHPLQVVQYTPVSMVREANWWKPQAEREADREQERITLYRKLDERKREREERQRGDQERE